MSDDGVRVGQPSSSVSGVEDPILRPRWMQLNEKGHEHVGRPAGKGGCKSIERRTRRDHRGDAGQSPVQWLVLEIDRQQRRITRWMGTFRSRVVAGFIRNHAPASQDARTSARHDQGAPLGETTPDQTPPRAVAEIGLSVVRKHRETEEVIGSIAGCFGATPSCPPELKASPPLTREYSRVSQHPNTARIMRSNSTAMNSGNTPSSARTVRKAALSSVCRISPVF